MPRGRPARTQRTNRTSATTPAAARESSGHPRSRFITRVKPTTSVPSTLTASEGRRRATREKCTMDNRPI
ncbi:MAG TPA: hypothetical protein VF026_10115, partial [Ktedonobacteraceae bacterium]